MLTFAVIGLFAGLIVLLTYFLFLFVVHPIWAIIEVCKDPACDKKKKAVWVFSIGVVGPFASVVYGLFFSKSQKMWRFSALAVGLFFVLAISYTFVPDDTKELVASTFHRSVASEP